LLYNKTMQKYQQELDKWFKDNNWNYWTPHEILARLFEEGGELARAVNHTHGPKKRKSEEADQNIEEEIGDIIYTLMCYANSNGIDLDIAIRKSMDKVIKRDIDRFN
jgi:NTP pyrophosphatase (non-canonical NTP hydrolase)